MPTSGYCSDPYVARIMKTLRPRSVLDVGIGTGRFAVICRKKLESASGHPRFMERSNWTTKIEGVEVYEPYISDVQRLLYDSIVIGDITNPTVEERLGSYDLCHMGDVLEPLSKEDGCRTLMRLLTKCSVCLIVTPYVVSPQEAEFGNVHEIHRSQWCWRDFLWAPFLWWTVVTSKVEPWKLLAVISQMPVEVLPGQYTSRTDSKVRQGFWKLKDGLIRIRYRGKRVKNRLLTIGGLYLEHKG